MRNEKLYILTLGMVLLLTGCSDKDFVSTLFGNEDDIKAGDAVLFTTHVPGGVTRATAEEEAFNNRMAAYNAVAEEYTFTVEMYKKGDGDTDELLGSGTYQPASTSTTTGEGESQVTTVTYPSDGSLKNTATPLYWPSTKVDYGFKATAGTTALEADQSDKAKLIAQDQLEGYGFEPLWNTHENKQTDSEISLNYRTPRGWYDANVATRGLAPGGVDAATWYKKIPLYLQHKRSLITIRLKAGEGVDRNSLLFENAKEHIETIIYSYKDNETLEIKPFAKKSAVDYAGTEDDTTDDVETTEYTAVVEPYNYLGVATTKPIARINLSSQHFTFYAGNDYLYDASIKTDADNHADAEDHMNGYNLQAGKHLVITATLGRGSRKILITAYVEEWDESITTSIVDDYGQAGDPIQINSRQQLYDFLKGDKNKPGNVAIIVPNALNLEQSGDDPLPWDYNTDGDGTNDLQLWCTLNLAGATLRTDHQIFSKINPLGNVVNGTISVGTVADAGTTVTAAIAGTNLGTIQHIDVVPKDANGNTSNGKASVAGLVQTNSGSILDCTSTLPVYSTDGVVGGIAAIQKYDADNGNVMPVIDGCTVNARVDGLTRGIGEQTPITVGAGIVGKAVGRVTNNTFVYGRTLLQHSTDFKNTIYAKYDDGDNDNTNDYDLKAYGNAWPTTASSNGTGIPETNTNSWPGQKYNNVIDSQEELKEVLDRSQYNSDGLYYRISADFTLTGWNSRIPGDNVGNDSGGSNVNFSLDGNNKTITTDGMLFNNIKNSVHDLTIRLSADLISSKLKTPGDESSRTGGDAIAPLAFSVNGANAVIRNIKVIGGNHRIQAKTVSGLVVWAYSGATVENCQSKAILQVWTDNLGTQDKIYSGGIVANAAQATITRCTFHSTGNTLFRNTSDNYTDNGSQSNTETNIYYGGILGASTTFGTTTKEYPSVLITDCTCWVPTATSNSEQMGSIVGYTEYTDINSNNQNGLKEGCQGNWWPEGSDPIGHFRSEGGVTVEQLIGRKNAVKPAENKEYDQ